MRCVVAGSGVLQNLVQPLSVVEDIELAGVDGPDEGSYPLPSQHKGGRVDQGPHPRHAQHRRVQARIDEGSPEAHRVQLEGNGFRMKQLDI